MAKKGVTRIGDKDYRQVSLRVDLFRKDFPISDGWGIVSELIECSSAQVVTKSSIVNPEGKVVGVGHAQETWDGSKILRTSALEVCETSSIGRALASIGLAGEEYASANEVQVAIAQQAAGATNKPAPKPRQTAEKAPARAPEPQASDNGWLGKTRARLSESAQDMGVIEGLVDQIGRSRDDAPDAGTWHACLAECNRYMSETKGFSSSEITRISARIHSILGTLPTTEEQSHDVF